MTHLSSIIVYIRDIHGCTAVHGLFLNLKWQGDGAVISLLQCNVYTYIYIHYPSIDMTISTPLTIISARVHAGQN